MTPVANRRRPPRLRQVKVLRTELLSPRMRRLTFFGPELAGLTVQQPAASVRVLFPPAGDELVMPRWTGNEFRLPDGRRPLIRTLTPRRVDECKLELDVDVVIHDGGAASGWAEAARPGDPAAVSGPARGYDIDPRSPGFFLAGDETAIPAISQILDRLPAASPSHACIEISAPCARMALPERPGATIDWLERPPGARPGELLVAAVRDASLAPGIRVWVAGEAAAMQQIRRQLFEIRGMPRSYASVSGYWKYGRAGTVDGRS